MVLCSVKHAEFSEGMIVLATQGQDCILKIEKGRAPDLDVVDRA